MMDQKEQIGRFSDDIEALIDRYRKEYDLSYAAAIGVLQIKIVLLATEALDNPDEDEE